MKPVGILLTLLTASALIACSTADTRDAEFEDAVASAAHDMAEDGKAEGRYVDRVVCKKMRQTGSRVGADKVCETIKVWEEYTAEERQAARKMLERDGSEGVAGTDGR